LRGSQAGTRHDAFGPTSCNARGIYLDYRPDQRGALKSFVEAAKEHDALQQDFDRIRAYLKDELESSTQTAAIFSCSGEPVLFETLQLEAAIDGHRLYVDREP
jgi:hypothetical protein